MKPVLVALLCVFLLGAAGCSGDGPSGSELGQQFGRGIKGEGKLSEDVDRTDDPYVKPRG